MSSTDINKTLRVTVALAALSILVLAGCEAKAQQR